MGRLVEDLLFLARAEVGAVRFEMQPLALQDVLDIALSEARVLAAANGATSARAGAGGAAAGSRATPSG